MTTTESSAGASASRTAPRERFVRSGDIDIAVYEEGNPNGETIILVHGWPDTHELWRGLAPLLADRFHVVSYDTRGHGKTTNPKRTADFKISELAKDFFAVADAVSPNQPVHAVGHDWGGVTVWEAICEPGAERRIASFTSVSGPNIDHLARWMRDRLSRPTPRNVAQPLSQLLHYTYMLFFATPVLPGIALKLGASKKVWKAFLRRQEGTPSGQVHLADTFREDIVRGLRIYRANSLSALSGPRERYTEVPVQLIVNTRDVAVRPASFDDTALWTRRLWRRDIPAGHWSPFSHPRTLADAVTELIDALAGNTPARSLRRAEREDIERHRDRRAFAREGAEVVVSDLNLESVQATAAAIVAEGGIAHAYQLNVADEDAVVAFAETVADAHGVPDILVNNAGIGHAGKFLDTPSAQFQRVMDVNFNGVVYGCRAFAKRMVDRGTGGHIVNLSSMAAYTPQQGMGPYASSKAAVLMFSDCLRAELAPAGIGVTTVCPGIVHTNITATTTFSGVSEEEQARKQTNADKLYRMRRYTPDKVAERILVGVRRNKAVLPVTPEAHAAYNTSRLAPALSRRMARSGLLDRI